VAVQHSDKRAELEQLSLQRDAALMAPEVMARLLMLDTAQGPQRAILWPHQERLFLQMRESRRLIVLKARQLGVTWAMAIYALWYALAHPGTTTMILSIGEREAREVLRRIGRLHESLDPQLRRWWKGRFTSEEATLRSEAGASQIISIPSGSTAGRGYTVSLLIGDEAAHWPESDQKLAAVLPTMADSGAVVLISTANGMSGRFYDIWADAPGNGWDTLFFRADDRPGRNKEWLESERSALGDLGAQEYPLDAEEAFISSGASVFDYDAIETLRSLSVEDPKWRGHITEDKTGVHAQAHEGGPWKVWEWPRPGRTYMLAADACAGKASGDYAHAVVVDTASWDQVACYHAKTEPHQFARELRNAGWLWQSSPEMPALLAPEANNHGAGVIAMLREWGYPRIYRHSRFDGQTVTESGGLGFFTSLKTKPIAISALQQAIREQAVGIRDGEALSEFTKFILTDTGKMQAAPGAHDDRVMTWAIAVTVLTHTAQARTLEAYDEDAQFVSPQIHIPRVSTLTGY
jgi:hypothetical protein